MSTLSDLTIAVLEHLGGDTTENRQTCLDAGEHGAAAGWACFTYYTDTCRFSDNNRRELTAKVREDMREIGVNTAAEFLHGFGCLKCESVADLDEAWGEFQRGAQPCNNSTLDLLGNALAWYALECAGHELEAMGWKDRDGDDATA